MWGNATVAGPVTLPIRGGRKDAPHPQAKESVANLQPGTCWHCSSVSAANLHCVHDHAVPAGRERCEESAKLSFRM